MGLSSKHFPERELTCKDGCGLNNTAQRLLDLAEKIRALLEKPMIPHSVCRCKANNDKHKGSPTSQHLHGKAMDFHVNGMEHKTLRDIIREAHKKGLLPELGGLGLYRWGVHIDVRATAKLVEWDHRKKKA